jgi:hypothetical protein
MYRQPRGVPCGKYAFCVPRVLGTFGSYFATVPAAACSGAGPSTLPDTASARTLFEAASQRREVPASNLFSTSVTSLVDSSATATLIAEKALRAMT